MGDACGKRVLHLVGSPAMGGIASHVVAAAQGLPVAGWQAEAAYFGERRGQVAPLRELAVGAGVRAERLPMGWLADPRGLWELRRWVWQRKPDLVHCHGYRATLLAMAARLRVPIVATCHGRATRAEGRVRAWQALELWAMRRLSLTIACSEHMAAWLVSRGLAADRVRVVWHGCAGPGAVAPLSGKGLTVAYVGRLTGGKGIEALIDAAAVLEAKLLIAGEGPLRVELEARAAAVGAQAEFLGYLSDVGGVYDAASVVALPSGSEALGMSLLEAAAHGRPVVATDVGGIPEAVAQGESGLLVPPGDDAALREGLSRLLCDADLREALGQAARRRWERLFTLEAMAQRLAGVYAELLGGSGPS